MRCSLLREKLVYVINHSDKCPHTDTCLLVAGSTTCFACVRTLIIVHGFVFLLVFVVAVGVGEVEAVKVKPQTMEAIIIIQKGNSLKKVSHNFLECHVSSARSALLTCTDSSRVICRS